MSHDAFNVLFLCTRNQARSLIAEAILNREGKGMFRAFSAGSDPGDAPHPATLAVLRAAGHATGSARSKSWDEFAGPDAPRLDFVFTLCDDAAGETCPVWPGQPMTAHWGVPDPAAADGNDAERHHAFAETYRMLARRIAAFASLPISSLDTMTLQARLHEIGRHDDTLVGGDA